MPLIFGAICCWEFSCVSLDAISTSQCDSQTCLHTLPNATQEEILKNHFWLKIIELHCQRNLKGVKFQLPTTVASSMVTICQLFSLPSFLFPRVTSSAKFSPKSLPQVLLSGEPKLRYQIVRKYPQLYKKYQPIGTYFINLLNIKKGLTVDSVRDPQTDPHGSLETWRPHFQNNGPMTILCKRKLV